ncbi:MAG TPA: MATE family efflux transporter [Rhizomicrobium sp.]|jgi:MATE family multidrug resistance protein
MSEIAELSELDLAHAGARVSGHGLDAWIAEARELLKLAGPLALTQLAQMAISVTDTLMLGRFSKEALAGAVLGNTLFYFTWIFASGQTAAVAPLIAHALGADPNDTRNVRLVTRMGFWAVLILSVPLVIFLMFAKSILLLLGQEPALADAASRFVVPLSLGLPFSLCFQVLRSYATALSRPNSALVVMLFTIVFNAVGDYILIFGHFGAPRLGLMGSGIASAGSLVFSFAVMALVVRSKQTLSRCHVFREAWRPDWSRLAEIYRLGMPIGITMLFEATLFFSANFIMGTFGVAAVAAHAIAMSVPSVTFMVPLGIGMAATVRVGLAAGARDGEAVRRAGYSAMIVAAAFMAVCTVLIFVFTFQIAALYLPPSAVNLPVLLLAVSFLQWAGAFQVFDGLQVVAALSLRGLKDARMPMWLAGASYWLVGFPTCIWLGKGLHMQGVGVWMGLSLALVAAAAVMCGRFWYLSRKR